MALSAACLKLIETICYAAAKGVTDAILEGYVKYKTYGITAGTDGEARDSVVADMLGRVRAYGTDTDLQQPGAPSGDGHEPSDLQSPSVGTEEAPRRDVQDD